MTLTHLPECFGQTSHMGCVVAAQVLMLKACRSLMKAGGDGSMELIAETVSDAYGYYRFRDLRPGAYVVRIGLEDGDVLTYSFGAPLGEIDSDFDQESGETDLIMLMSGQTLRNVDAGFADKMD